MQFRWYYKTRTVYLIAITTAYGLIGNKKIQIPIQIGQMAQVVRRLLLIREVWVQLPSRTNLSHVANDSPPLLPWWCRPWRKTVELGTAHSRHPKGYLASKMKIWFDSFFAVHVQSTGDWNFWKSYVLMIMLIVFTHRRGK